MDTHGTAVYPIRITGRFDDLTVTCDENGETTLCGPVIDQAALFGLLAKVRDLNLPLLSVCCLAPS